MNAKFLFNLPVPVTLMRFLTALLVFNFGILIPFIIYLDCYELTGIPTARPLFLAYISKSFILALILKSKSFLFYILK